MTIVIAYGLTAKGALTHLYIGEDMDDAHAKCEKAGLDGKIERAFIIKDAEPVWKHTYDADEFTARKNAAERAKEAARLANLTAAERAAEQEAADARRADAEATELETKAATARAAADAKAAKAKKTKPAKPSKKDEADAEAKAKADAEAAQAAANEAGDDGEGDEDPAKHFGE